MSVPTTESLIEAKVQIYMPLSLDAEIRALAREHDRPLSREIRAAIREYVDRCRAEAVTK